MTSPFSRTAIANFVVNAATLGVGCLILNVAIDDGWIIGIGAGLILKGCSVRLLGGNEVR